MAWIAGPFIATYNKVGDKVRPCEWPKGCVHMGHDWLHIKFGVEDEYEFWLCKRHQDEVVRNFAPDASELRKEEEG